MTLIHHTTHLNGVDLHYVTAGDGYPIIFLHGFPAFWYVWKNQLNVLKTHCRVVALDGRGVNMSSKPQDIKAYHIDRLVGDVIALADHLGFERFSLVGQDWGGSLAWAVAQNHPHRVDKLLVANAPPIDTLLYALATIPKQREESAYMDRLKADGSEYIFLANDCEMLWQMSFAGFVQSGIYTSQDREAYINAWQQSGAVKCFLHWYRANLPQFDCITAQDHRANHVKQITTPTLLLWGEHEKAFTIECLALIPDYAPNTTIQQISQSDHWIMLDQIEMFNTALLHFFDELIA